MKLKTYMIALRLQWLSATCFTIPLRTWICVTFSQHFWFNACGPMGPETQSVNLSAHPAAEEEATVKPAGGTHLRRYCNRCRR